MYVLVLDPGLYPDEGLADGIELPDLVLTLRSAAGEFTFLVSVILLLPEL